jgi:hypothetical protein
MRSFLIAHTPPPLTCAVSKGIETGVLFLMKLFAGIPAEQS